MGISSSPLCDKTVGIETLLLRDVGFLQQLAQAWSWGRELGAALTVLWSLWVSV